MSRNLSVEAQRRWRLVFVAMFLATLVVCGAGTVYLAIKGRAHANMPR
ncbi:hypothetical protein [Longispora urticae]